VAALTSVERDLVAAWTSVERDLVAALTSVERDLVAAWTSVEPEADEGGGLWALPQRESVCDFSW
jgi:hypothetical protein